MGTFHFSFMLFFNFHPCGMFPQDKTSVLSDYLQLPLLANQTALFIFIPYILLSNSSASSDFQMSRIFQDNSDQKFKKVFTIINLLIIFLGIFFFDG